MAVAKVASQIVAPKFLLSGYPNYKASNDWTMANEGLENTDGSD
jgi:hypothetical protein